MQSFVNGQPSEQITLTNRGFLYGDGLFETTRIVDQKIEFLALHLSRLADGLRRLLFQDVEQILAILQSQLADILPRYAAQYNACKCIVSRNSQQRGYAPINSTVDIVIQLFNFSSIKKIPKLTVGLCNTALSENHQLAGIKHLNRLDNVLAKAEVASKHWHEGWMHCTEGWIFDGVQSNVFYKMGQQWFTPPIVKAGVQGVQRTAILLTNKQSIALRALHKTELAKVESAFMSNRLTGFSEVCSLDGRLLTGCQSLIQMLQQDMDAFDA